MREVVLFTSGIDSYILHQYLSVQGRNIQCVYFDHGGRYVENEKRRIKKLPFNVIIDTSLSLGDIETEDAHIPNRNFLFALMAVSKYSDKIWIGGSLSDRVEDNNRDIFTKFSILLSQAHKRHISIDSPFYNCYKEDMINWYVDHMGNRSEHHLITDTFSCFNPVEERMVTAKIRDEEYSYYTDECLNCPACFRKSASLFTKGVFINIKNKHLITHYEVEFNNSIDINSRSITTLGYIDAWKKINR